MAPNTSKEAHIKVYARANPDKSATAIYEHFKGSKYATRKTDTLRYVREERGQKVTPTKQKASIPVKYRKPETSNKGRFSDYRPLPRFPSTKDRGLAHKRLNVVNKAGPDSYLIANVRPRGQKVYHITFRDEKTFNSELNRLSRQYNFDKRTAQIDYDGPYDYQNTVFVAPEFKDELKRRGLW